MTSGDALLVRRCTADDFGVVLEIVNDAAEAYRGVIPADRWHDPYMSADELAREIVDGVEFWGIEEAGRAKLYDGSCTTPMLFHDDSSLADW